MRVEGVVIAIAVLLVGLSYLATINEYAAVFGSEMKDAYDCDGPTVVLAFAVPGLVFGLFAMGLSIRASRRNPTFAARAFIGVALFVVALAAARIAPAIDEARKNAAADSPCR